jgi:transcriptional regulator with XRE-family HTH domain
MGRRLRAARRARGKSQEVIAGLAGISSGYLSRLENGLRSLDRLSLIVALAHALEIPPTELIIDLWSGDDWTRTKDVRALAGVGQR